MTSHDFEPSGFFVVRSPLLAFDELEAWRDGAADAAELRARLHAALERADVSDALFVGTPGLYEAWLRWRDDPTTPRARDAERSLVASYTRMASRPTPFGLFAGCGVGRIGAETRMELGPRDRCRRLTRIDVDYLTDLADSLVGDRAVRRGMRFRPNSSMYTAGGQLRYAAAIREGSGRSYQLVAVDTADYLTAVLDLAAEGAGLDELADALQRLAAVEREEAVAFCDELVDEQLLVADVAPPVTGREPAEALASQLSASVATRRAGEVLGRAIAELDRIDAGGLGSPPGAYAEVAGMLAELGVAADPAALFQADLVTPASAVIGPAELADIVRGVDVHSRLTPRPDDELTRFHAEFVQRYGQREVPLGEALDEECGLGFAASRAPGSEGSPLLRGLSFPVQAQHTVTWGAREQFLLDALTRLGGEHELELQPRDIDAMAPSDPAPLPDAFAAMAALGRHGDGYRVHLIGVSGPSGVRLLGRFCHSQPELRDAVDAHVAAEHALHPDKAFFEIAHLPEGRTGNILARPVLRPYELEFLGRSGAGRERVLRIDDLVLSSDGARFVLRSRSLGREVVPRLTSAHNFFGSRNLGVYRFLCMLQHQGGAWGASWKWGVFDRLPFLPRVVHGNVVLARAQWTVEGSEWTALLRGGDAGARAIGEWRKRRRLPRFVALVEGDNELLGDLDNDLSARGLVERARRYATATLVEMFPEPDGLVLRGPDGRYVAELIVPFVRTVPHAGTAPPAAGPATVRRRFATRSEWLYVKLYGGVAALDAALVDAVGPALRDAVSRGAADGWFFVRYADPEPHLRLRVHGEAGPLRDAVLPAVEDVVRPLFEAEVVRALQVDTYEREVERYGGDEGVTLSERLFCEDSEAVLDVLTALRGDAGARWRLALVGVHLLLDDLGLDAESKRDWARTMRDAYAREHNMDKLLRRQLGERFREHREFVDAVAAGAASPPAAEALRARSARLEPVAARLRELDAGAALTVPMWHLAGSYAHMHVNRMLRASQRAHEFVIVDMLERAYHSVVARGSR